MARRTGMKVEEVITERILEALNGGTIPWKKPWNTAGPPRNFISKKPYRGINLFLLSMMSCQDPRFMTYNQAKSKGWKVTKGKGIPIVFWKMIDSKQTDDNGKPKKIPLMRYYLVWNVADVEGDVPALDLTTNEDAATPIEICEAIVEGMPKAPPIFWDSDSASYSPHKDIVRMPPKDRFHSPEEAYSTLFHELAHSTGHASRLNRFGTPGAYESGSYAFEELVAEFAAAILCGHGCIETTTVENSAAYIASWKRRLKDDPKLIIRAASAGQKASDFILDDSPEHKEETETESAVA